MFYEGTELEIDGIERSSGDDPQPDPPALSRLHHVILYYIRLYDIIVQYSIVHISIVDNM